MELEQQIQPGEQILWSGTKHKKVSFFEAIFNPMLLFAGIWFAFDMTFITVFLEADRMSDNGNKTLQFMIPFFLFHMMPVWIYLGGILTSVRKAKNTRYCVTDQAVYIQSGFFDTKVERKDYSHFIEVTAGQSFWDKRAETGDVRITLDEIYYSGKHRTPHNRKFNIENIADHEEVFRTVQQARSAAFQRRMGGYQPAAPVYGERSLPQFGQPQYGAPQVPQYGNPQVPQYGNPQIPQYGMPQYQPPQPAANTEAEMPELLTPTDDFVDPTLAAFDFQNQDPADHNDFPE